MNSDDLWVVVLVDGKEEGGFKACRVSVYDPPHWLLLLESLNMSLMLMEKL